MFAQTFSMFDELYLIEINSITRKDESKMLCMIADR